MHTVTLQLLQDNAFTAVVFLAVIIGILAGEFFHGRIPRAPLDKNHDLRHYRAPRFNWLGAVLFAVAFTALISWLSLADEKLDNAERARDLQTKLAAAGCPEKQPGDTDVIVFTIDTTADPHTDKPFRAVHCSRIVERGWIRQQPKPAIAAR